MTPQHPTTVIAVAGGDAVVPAITAGLPSDATVVAADSGLHLADHLGLSVDVVVGDMDSVSPDALLRADELGAEVIRHPAAKDKTDLELALDLAIARAPKRIIVIGGHGGRLDHQLGNLLLLANDRYSSARVTAHMGPAVVAVVRTEAQLTGTPGSYVSLLPVHGGASGVTTKGLAFPLNDDDLLPGATRGVSNTLVDDTATVQVRGGVLLAVQPDPTASNEHDADQRDD